jgi:hypothetical protein
MRTCTHIRPRVSSSRLRLPDLRRLARARVEPTCAGHPATPPVALSPAAASPNPAKGHPFSRLAVCFVNPDLAMGRVTQQLLTLAAGETLAAPPFLLGPASNTCRATPKPKGVFVAHAVPHAAEAVVNPPDLVRPAYPVFATCSATPIRATPDQPRSHAADGHNLPHVRPHHRAPQKIPAESFAPRHTSGHVSNSWLIAACVAAISAPRCGL